MKCFGEYRENELGCHYCNLFTRMKCYHKTIKNMETKEVKIECPEGFEIDKEKSTFEKIVFKKKEQKLPKTYTDFLNNYKYFDRVVIPIPTKYEDSFRALRMLIELRDVYNDGWTPDWNNSTQFKYTIFVNRGDLTRYTNTEGSHVLAFKTEDLRNEFYKNFKDIIEQAKELI